MVDQFADGDNGRCGRQIEGPRFRRHDQASQFQSRSRIARFDERARAGFDRRSRRIRRALSRERDRRVTWATSRITVKGLTVARVDAENNLLMIRGAVPGANGSVVVVKKADEEKR